MREERSSFPVRNNGAPDLLRLLDDGPNLPIAAALKVELHLLGEWLVDPVSLFLTLPHPHPLPLPLPLPHRSILVGLLPQRNYRSILVASMASSAQSGELAWSVTDVATSRVFHPRRWHDGS